MNRRNGMCPSCWALWVDGQPAPRDCTACGPPCICDRDTLSDNMATPGCPQHAPAMTGKQA